MNYSKNINCLQNSANDIFIKKINTQSLLIDSLFKVFNQNDIPYCILHSYKYLPSKIESDLDIVVSSEYKNKLDIVLNHITFNSEFSIIQNLYYDIPNGYYYVFYKHNSNPSLFIAFDFLVDDIGINRYYLKSYELLHNRIKYKNFYIPTFGIQIIYLLIKKAVKRQIYNNHYNKLFEYYLKDPINVENTIKSYFNKYISTKLINAFQKKKSNEIGCLLPQIVVEMKKKRKFLKIHSIFWSFYRIVKRFSNPTGMYIVILSPDGGGKTSVSSAISQKLQGAFRNIKQFHWRPWFFTQLRTFLSKTKIENVYQNVNLHNLKKRNKTISLFRWLYYSIDYIVGYYLKILPLKIKTTAVIMDRYYYDIIVDPVRYGFNLPQWLLKSVLPLIPKPDLTIYLDNKPEELYKRKQELRINELDRQVCAWREFIPTLPNARIVTTDKPLDDVANEVTRLVLARRAEMTRKMLNVDPDASFYLWKFNDIKRYAALPSRHNCRWIIPLDKKYSDNTWDFYLPYSFNGRLGKNYLKFISNNNILGHDQKLDFGLMDNSAELKKCLEKVFDKSDLVPAVSIGTPSPYQKITVIIMNNSGKVLGYAKIGATQSAIARVKHEAYISSILIDMLPGNARFSIPKLEYEGKLQRGYVAVFSYNFYKGKQGPAVFDANYANILNDLSNLKRTKMRFSESSFYKYLKKSISSYPLSYKQLLIDGLLKIEKKYSDTVIDFSISHGDFAPWNMLWNSDNKCLLFDWESALLEAPIGIDFVHYLFQISFLLKKHKGLKLLNAIIDSHCYELLKKEINIDMLPVNDFVMLYLLRMAVDEDKQQQLSKSAVERRNLIKLLLKQAE